MPSDEGALVVGAKRLVLSVDVISVDVYSCALFNETRHLDQQRDLRESNRFHSGPMCYRYRSLNFEETSV